MVLFKLRFNLPFSSLAVLFSITDKTCSRYFYKVLQYLSVTLQPLIYWPSKEEILESMPKCFSEFKKTRVILDCTEIPLHRCKCLKCRILSYSHYKGTNTVKFMAGVTPAGQISYISKCYGGRSSDKAIFNQEQIILKLDPYDGLMVDKGFLIEKECEEKLVYMYRPPFLRGQSQFSKTEAEKTAKIARARVHVERVIQRIKLYRILTDQIDWHILPYINDIVIVVAAIVNLSSPILRDDQF